VKFGEWWEWKMEKMSDGNISIDKLELWVAEHIKLSE
jgi:hypothetical protein